ncbi:MAG: hypothetical protein KGO82_19025 [Bacteroidota bacterium]|nr:hypothetical protein [Bacteroidota bacterium]
MKKKPRNIFVDPKNKKDQKKAIDALKDKNFHLDDKENERIHGGFIERGSAGGASGNEEDGHNHDGPRHGE